MEGNGAVGFKILGVGRSTAVDIGASTRCQNLCQETCFIDVRSRKCHG